MAPFKTEDLFGAVCISISLEWKFVEMSYYQASLN